MRTNLKLLTYGTKQALIFPCGFKKSNTIEKNFDEVTYAVFPLFCHYHLALTSERYFCHPEGRFIISYQLTA